jgi:serine/threonine-protein kinase
VRTFGKYRLVEPIACGGMAEVWRAEAPGPEGFLKEVALKLMRARDDPRGEFVRMFVTEARLASRLTHANVVQVFDFDQVDGQYYIAMELVCGKTLREVVDRCRERGVRLGLARAVHVMAEVARGLAYAHRLEEGGRPVRLVHRDVSPQNVLVSFEGEVKLADFGIARAMDAVEATAPGTVKGKAAYMAPEQARGEVVDARADVFALGVMLWELCAGRRLFARDSEANTLAALLGGDPVSPPSAWNEGVPPELDALVMGALERDPCRRTASAEEVAQGLAALRLRLATDAEDLDLRAFMRRLWPDGPDPVRREGQTLVRPALESPPAGGQDDDAGGHEDAAERQNEDEVPTRTLPRPNRGGARRRSAVAALVVGCLVVGAAGLLALTRRPGLASARVATPTPTPTPTATATATEIAIATTNPAATTTAHQPAQAPGPGSAPAPNLPITSALPQPKPRTPSSKSQPISLSSPSQPMARVVIQVFPWAIITIDGQRRGEAPLTVELPPGWHRLQAHHPTLGDDEEVLTVKPGQQVIWRPRLAR